MFLELVTKSFKNPTCDRASGQIDGLVGSSQAEAEEKTSETVIQKIFDELPVP